MDIEKFLQMAEKEYELNGRSERFITMENIVLASENPTLIIKFSELKGAKISSIATGVKVEMMNMGLL